MLTAIIFLPIVVTCLLASSGHTTCFIGMGFTKRRVNTKVKVPVDEFRSLKAQFIIFLI